MPATVDEIINAPAPDDVDQAMQPGEDAGDQSMSFSDMMGHMDATHQAIVQGLQGADAADQEKTKQENAAIGDSQAGYRAMDKGGFGTFSERNSPNNFGSIERRDYYDLGIGTPGFKTDNPNLKKEGRGLAKYFQGEPEQTFINRDTNALPVLDGKTLHATPRVDTRFENFPSAPAAVRARSSSTSFPVSPMTTLNPSLPKAFAAPIKFVPQPFDLRRQITQPQYPQVPKPSI